MKWVLKLVLECLALVFSAWLVSLAFPGRHDAEGWGAFAFFSLAPVFLIIDKTSWGRSVIGGAVYGFFYYFFYNYWLSTFHPLAILIAPVLESVQYALVYPVLKAASKWCRKWAWIAQTLLYVGYLYVTQMGFLGYPYGNISGAVTSFTTFIQIADITGIWGICLLVAAPQALLAQMIAERDFKSHQVGVLGVIALHVLNLVYGSFALWNWSNNEAETTWKVAAVQHSADTWKGGYQTYRTNYENMRDLTLEALASDPEIDMVSWSETAFVPSVTWHAAHPYSGYATRLCEEFMDFGTSLGVPLVTGNPEGVIDNPDLPPYLEDGTWNWKTYNTVILFDEGEVKESYRKQRLVPFTENFPYEEQFPRLYALLKANDYKWWERGWEQTVFTVGDVSFSTPICFEDTFGYLSAEFVLNGADFILNLTNDFWSQEVPAEMQHMQLASYRAIENRRPLLRSTNSGITCMVLPSGEVVEPLEPFTMAWNVYEVPIDEDAGFTFYTLFPDLFAKLSLAGGLVSLAAGLVLTIRSRGKGNG